MKSKALNTIQDNHDRLGNIIDQDKERLLDSIRTLEKRVIADTKRLVSGKDGKLVGPRVNLKQAHQIHADLIKNFKETYEDTAFRVTKGYNQSVKMVKTVYKDLDVSMKFTGIDKDMISELQKRSYNEYLAYGKAAQESISQAMYNAVLTKGSYEDLVGSVSAALTGNLSKSGKPMSAYADVWANDGIMNFHQSVLMKKGNDAGLTSYLYVGNVMNTTRPFCAERVMQTFTQEEIESWDFNWKGKSGPALTNRGGWNCRHHWQPVKKEDVKTLEKEIEKDEEIQKELKEAKEIEPVVSIPEPAEIWEPAMSKEAADNWARDSKLQETYYHGTSGKSAKDITNTGFRLGEGEVGGKAYGDGVYIGGKKSAASRYAGTLDDGTVLPLRVNVQNPYIVKDENDWFRVMDDAESKGLSFLGREATEDIPKYFKDLRYDALDVRNYEKRGGILVFDPKNVTVIVSDSQYEEISEVMKLREVPEVEEIEEAPEYQSFDKYLESADFDWEAMEIDPDDVPTIQNNIIKSRLSDGGVEISEEEANDVRTSIEGYTSDSYREFGQWLRDPEGLEEEFPELGEAFSEMSRDLNKYVNETQPFDPNVALYRGKNEVGSLEGLEVGGEIDLQYLSSFSTEEVLAQDFTVGGENPVIMVINPGNETYSASLAEFSESGHEREVLLSDKNRLSCTSIEDKVTEEGRRVKYMYFDSVEVAEEQRELEAELEEERLEVERIAKEAEEERVAKEESERVAEEERLAKEELEAKLEEEKRMAEVARKIQEDERIAKEEAEKELEVTKKEFEKEKSKVKISRYQDYDSEFVRNDYDWKKTKYTAKEISKIQSDIIKERFKDGGIQISTNDSQEILRNLRKYSSETYYVEYSKWVNDKKYYRELDVGSIKEFKIIEKNLNRYINETPPFNPETELYRGTGAYGDLAKVTAGDEISITKMSSFTSTEEDAVDFALKSNSPTIMIINKNQTVYSSSIAEFSEYGEEKEILLSDKNSLSCTHVEMGEDGIKYVYFNSV